MSIILEEGSGGNESEAAAGDSEGILAQLAVIWEIDIGDTELAVTFEPSRHVGCSRR